MFWAFCTLCSRHAYADEATDPRAPDENNLRPRAQPRPAIKLAITVDDLPGGGPEVHGYTHVQMVKDIVSVLRAHRVPQAGGFIVGGMIETDPARNEALDVWVQAGFLVGNHSYSHDHIAEIGLANFSNDVTKNRTVIDPLEARTQQVRSYFRFPYLEEGNTREERHALWQLLERERYTLVRPSIAFSDTDWVEAYLRCQEQHDESSLLALDHSYLAQAQAHLHWSLAAANAALGRAIPHILLLHVNVPTAANLDKLLRAYEAEGVQFISVEDALREPAYVVFYDTPGGDLLSQASTTLNRPTPPKPPALDTLIDRIYG